MATRSISTLVVIPVFNEGSQIQQVISNIKKSGYRSILVVDDGSSDDTFQKIKQERVMFLRHFLNRGKGAAIKTGIAAGKILKPHILITMDGDGQHDPKDIDKLAAKIKLGYDVVLGTRILKSNKIPFFKRIANLAGNLVTFIAYGLWVNDSQCGFRAYSKKAYQCINTITDAYEYDSEVIREIKYHNLRYIEIPIHMKYTTYSQSKPHRQTLLNGLKMAIRMTFFN